MSRECGNPHLLNPVLTTEIVHLYLLRQIFAVSIYQLIMNKFGLGCYQFLKRHSEALFIVAFILADCFASGWVLTVGTVAAVLYVVLPAIRTLYVLSPVERITFLKAFVKTTKVQRLAVLLFWIYSVRLLIYAATESLIFSSGSASSVMPTTVSSAFLLGAQQFAPLSYLANPVLIYIVACFTAILLRAQLKATKQDPDLISQRQKWSAVSQFLFSGAFVASIYSIVWNKNGPGLMLSNWLLASGRDANLFNDSPPDNWENPPFGSSDGGVAPMLPPADTAHGFLTDLSFMQWFDTFVQVALSVAVLLVLFKPVLRLHAFLNSFCWRVVSPTSLQNTIEAFLEALRLPSRFLTFREAHPFANNALRTLVWILICYSSLFWLFGFCGGPLGLAIQNWMIASAVDAHLCNSMAAPEWLFESPFRIFLGSIVALYGTAPMAVTACVFLPYVAARKIVLNADGISFLQGPYFSLWGRQFRLWTDLKSLTVKVQESKKKSKPQFKLTFRSGGNVAFNTSQVSPQDLKVLLDSIDQYAAACAVDPEIYTICQALQEVEPDKATSDGITDSAIERTAASEFKSTIFVPLKQGEFLPGTETRVIKLLSSKPLCAVYLARNNDGRLVTVKQFYLADETDETKALEKILNREYELLSNLDHPDIAKVLNSFTFEKSTYLVIEHRLGSDMRAIVNEHGPRSEGLTIAWAKKLCDTMIYLHSREPVILHRDLTPDNVIVGEDGNLRLIDFGAAREFLDGLTGTMLGKHCYVSPEQLRGDATIESDIYSFGGTLYFLLTGRDPISLSQSSPAKFMDCSDELDRLIRDCTEFDEEKRPRSFDEILKRLNGMDSGFRIQLSAVKEKATV